MPVPSYHVSCVRNDNIASGIYEFAFEKPEGFSFKAGKFILFDIGLIDNPADIQTRAMSIASGPSEKELIFVAKMKEGGRISRWIEEVLRPGVDVRMQGPFGNFLLDAQTDKEYLFIATSTGIAPFRSQILEALERGDKRRMDVVFGVRAEEDMFWKEEFETIAQRHENLFVHFALSQPTDAWKGHKGRVQTLVPLIAKDFSRKSVYVCGSPDMTKELKQICLEQWGMEKKDLHVEGYI
jgi:Na+-transporting NADH:ubiquinone oxidoreductase subunit F